MSSAEESGARSCASVLLDIKKQRIYRVRQMGTSILNDHPVLRDAVKAQVSCVSHSSGQGCRNKT